MMDTRAEPALFLTITVSLTLTRFPRWVTVLQRLAYSRRSSKERSISCMLATFIGQGVLALRLSGLHFGQRIVRKIALRIKAQAALEFSATFFSYPDLHRSDCARPPPLLSGSGRPLT